MPDMGFSGNILEPVLKKNYLKINNLPPALLPYKCMCTFRFQNQFATFFFFFVWKVAFYYLNTGYIYSEIRAIRTETCTTIIKLIFLKSSLITLVTILAYQLLVLTN